MQHNRSVKSIANLAGVTCNFALPKCSLDCQITRVIPKVSKHILSISLSLDPAGQHLERLALVTGHDEVGVGGLVGSPSPPPGRQCSPQPGASWEQLMACKENIIVGSWEKRRKRRWLLTAWEFQSHQTGQHPEQAEYILAEKWQNRVSSH